MKIKIAVVCSLLASFVLGAVAASALGRITWPMPSQVVGLADQVVDEIAKLPEAQRLEIIKELGEDEWRIMRQIAAIKE